MAKVRKSKGAGLAAYLRENVDYKIASGRDEFYEMNDPDHWVSTGILSLDMAIGGKGIPSNGRVILISADTSIGKTLLGLHLGRAFQNHPKKPGFVHFIETEGSVDPRWVENLGVNVDEDFLIQPRIRCLEDLFDHILTSIRYHKKHEPKRPIFFYIDSISTCPPGAALKAMYGGKAFKQKGAKAAFLSQHMELVNTELLDSNCTLLFISQLRNKISINPMQPIIGDQQSVAGGNTLGFHNSLHMRLRQVYGSEVYAYAGAKKKDRVYEQEGVQVEVYIYKSKISFPFRKAFLPLYWRKTATHSSGFDIAEDALNWFVDRELVSKYSGKDKALSKAGATEIELPSGSHVFVGIPGWGELWVQDHIQAEIRELALQNIHSKGNKDESSEDAETPGEPNRSAKEPDADQRRNRQRQDDLDIVSDEPPDFTIDSEDEVSPSSRRKVKTEEDEEEDPLSGLGDGGDDD